MDWEKWTNGRVQGAARRRAEGSLSGTGSARRRPRRGLARLAVLGPHRAPALRPRAAAERRLLAARGLHGPGRLRRACCAEMRLADGTLWPMPVTLDVTPAVRRQAQGGDTHRAARPRGRAARRHRRRGASGSPTSEPRPQAVFGTDRRDAPGRALPARRRQQPVYLGGRLAGHRSRRCTTTSGTCATRRTSCATEFQQARAGAEIVAFQTRNPMHRAHQELTFRAAKEVEANLLIHPVVGMTKPGDVDHYTRVRCYEALLAALSRADDRRSRLLPLAMRMGGPREALLARDHPQELRLHPLHRRPRPRRPRQRQRRASRSTAPTTPRSCSQKHEDEIGIDDGAVQADGLRRRTETQYVPDDEVAAGRDRTLDISGTELRRRLHEGREIPEWFTFPEVVEELRRTHPPRAPAGLHRLLHRPLGLRQVDDRQRAAGQAAGDGRPAGDAARRRPGPQAPLVASSASRKEHRDLNIRRIGYVASRDHQERRHRHLRADRPLRRDPQARCAT